MEHPIGISEAIGSFSRAVKFAVQVLPHESLAEYLAKVETENLQLLLELFEKEEEYEICALIARVLQTEKQEIKP